MLCPNCNNNIGDNTKFCPECGTAVSQNENFNNYFAQDNSINNNYQNPPSYQQNNFGGAYPNNDYYNQQQYAPVDAGEGKASASMICGILSLFMGPILSIISLVFASLYKKSGNGQNAGKVKVGKICSWISIVSYVVLILLVFAGSAIFMSTFKDDMQVDAVLDYGDYDTQEDDFYYDTEDTPYNDYQDKETILFEKAIPEEGELVYDKNDIKVTLHSLKLVVSSSMNQPAFEAEYTIDAPYEYDLSFDAVYLNGEKSESHSMIRLGDGPSRLSFYHSDINSIEDLNEITCDYILGDEDTDENVLSISFNLY